ncbi:MAG: helix-turn-helix domain-containing protein [Pseudonocardiaceae bacterium]
MTELTIGDRIRELRRGIFTQNDLAAAADVSVDVIRKLEQGRRHTASIATLARIAEHSVWSSLSCWARQVQLPPLAQVNRGPGG